MNELTLLAQATEGRLGGSELQKVVSALSDRTDGIDHYTLLLALGRAMATQHRGVVESFLHEHRDPMMVRLALQILCKFWGGTSRYLDQVRSLMELQSWDEEGDARQMAISIAGEYLREGEDRRLLEELLTIVANANEDEFTRQDAYLSVARAMGIDWDELPRISQLPSLEELVDPDLLRAARERLLREKRA